MPPPNFVNVSISKALAERLHKLRQQLVDQGLKGLPADTISLASVVDYAVSIAERALAAERRAGSR